MACGRFSGGRRSLDRTQPRPCRWRGRTLARCRRETDPAVVSLGGKSTRRQGPSQHAVGLATVVEYIHNATLLHDDVVDLAVERRGQPTARMIHGNTVVVAVGDWLLVRALRLIHQTGSPWALPAALDCIDELIEAEILH